MPQAVEYEITVTGYPPFRLDASQVTCGPEVQGDRTPRVCSTPFPPEQALIPGQPAFLRVGARLSLMAEPSTSDRSHLTLLTPEQRAAVETQRAHLLTVPVEETTRDLLLARLYVTHKLWEDALATCEAVLQRQASAEVSVMVGDLYLITQLYPRAQQSYASALELSPSPATRAAAMFGVGRVSYATHRFKEAADSFAQAAALYTDMGAEAEAAEARRATEDARQRQQQ